MPPRKKSLPEGSSGLSPRELTRTESKAFHFPMFKLEGGKQQKYRPKKEFGDSLEHFFGSGGVIFRRGTRGKISAFYHQGEIAFCAGEGGRAKKREQALLSWRKESSNPTPG